MSQGPSRAAGDPPPRALRLSWSGMIPREGTSRPILMSSDETVAQVRETVRDVHGVWIRESDGVLVVDAEGSPDSIGKSSAEAIYVDGCESVIMSYGEKASTRSRCVAGSDERRCFWGLRDPCRDDRTRGRRQYRKNGVQTRRDSGAVVWEDGVGHRQAHVERRLLRHALRVRLRSPLHRCRARRHRATRSTKSLCYRHPHGWKRVVQRLLHVASPAQRCGRSQYDQ